MLSSDSVKFTYPNLGLGAQLRHSHIDHLLMSESSVDWLEINYRDIADNHGYARHLLCELSASKSVVLVFNDNEIYDATLSKKFVNQLCKLTDIVQPIGLLFRAKDHGVIFSNEMIQHTAVNVRQLQKATQTNILVETPVIDLKQSSLHPATFIDNLVNMTACGICLNIDNVLASVEWDQHELSTYLRALPMNNIAQIYFNAKRAASNDADSLTLDVYKAVQRLTGGVATLIERSDATHNVEYSHFGDLIESIQQQSKRLDHQVVESSNLPLLDEIMAYQFEVRALA